VRVLILSLAMLICLSTVGWSKSGTSDPLAEAFGRMPDVWGLRLSPDGSKVSMLHQHEEADFPVLIIYDVASQTGEMILASQKDKFWIDWCDWANNERLLCGFKRNIQDGYDYYPVTRLVGVNADGSKVKVLLQRMLRNHFSQFQDRVVDWLVDDERHVLVQVARENSTGISKLDIYSGKTSRVLRGRQNARYYMTDGHGQLRLIYYFSEDELKWRYTLAGEDDWHDLFEADITDDSKYLPVGFGEDLNTLLVMKNYEGRSALWAEDLTGQEEPRVLFSHPRVDVNGVKALGKYRRLVGAEYITDVGHLHFFDDSVQRIMEILNANMPGKVVTVLDEGWNHRYYLIHIGSDQDPGAYYRYDRSNNHVYKIFPRYSSLAHKKLSAVQSIAYVARDAVEVPAYLTLPLESEASKLPVVILPHGGPESRDVWGFDWLPQFLTAWGYAVLQPNFRGSGGYGEDWAGEGGFRAWRQALNDITDGARHLIEKGIADPDRVCIVGWSYGGYAALMSGLEEAALYQCVISIAPVTDPADFVEDYRHFIRSRVVRDFVGKEDEVLKEGSPLKRVEEMSLPVMLLHGEMDLNVEVGQSRQLADALEDEGKEYEFKAYENVDHHFLTNSSRIDMLTRIGRFLDRHIGEQARTRPKTPQASASALSGP